MPKSTIKLNEQAQKEFNELKGKQLKPQVVVDPDENNATKVEQPTTAIIKARKLVTNYMQTSESKKLDYLTCTKILLKYFYFTRFSINENERIAVYVDDANNERYGLYTQNYDYIKRLINSVYPKYNSKDINEVLNKIELTDMDIKEPEHTKNLIPVGNGIFNLKTKKLEPYTPSHVFSSKVNTKYNQKYLNEENKPVIDGWNFDNWLNNIAKDTNNNVDTQVVKLLWQVIADALNGNYSRGKALILNSEHGGSGKGTYQDLISNLVGKNNVATIKIQDFSKPFTLSRLMGKSVCIGDDNSSNYIKDSSNFNSVVTGDLINIEYKGKDGFTARVSPTVIQSFNGLPHFSNKGGTYRRLLIVPFRQDYRDAKENKKIKEVYLKRKDVLEYVLCTALNYYSDFDKFYIPDVSKYALNEFEKENDPIKSFVEDEFNKWNLPKVSTKTTYQSYKSYCNNNGYTATSSNTFIRQIQKYIPNYSKKASRMSQDDFNKLRDAKEDKDKLIYVAEVEKPKSNIRCFVQKY